MAIKKYFTEEERVLANRAKWKRWAMKPEAKETLTRVKNAYIERKYGLDHSEVVKLLQSQDFKCAICGVEISEDTMHIDHDHLTNKVRGLLCFTHSVIMLG